MKTFKITDLTNDWQFSEDYKTIHCIIDGTVEVLKVETKFKFFQCVTFNNKDYYLN